MHEVQIVDQGTFLALKRLAPGDMVELRAGEGLAFEPGVVERAHWVDDPDNGLVVARPVRKHAAGRRLNAIRLQFRTRSRDDRPRESVRRSPRLRLPDESSPLRHQQANVFADWLEENGHPDAGGALRRAFPLIPRE